MQPQQPPGRDDDLLWRILDTAHEAFIMIDADGLILEFNRESERTFGFSREEVLGRELAATIVPDRDRGAHRAGLRRYAETGIGDGDRPTHRDERSASRGSRVPGRDDDLGGPAGRP